jgi:hypothetical protein
MKQTSARQFCFIQYEVGSLQTRIRSDIRKKIQQEKHMRYELTKGSDRLSFLYDAKFSVCFSTQSYNVGLLTFMYNMTVKAIYSSLDQTNVLNFLTQ